MITNPPPRLAAEKRLKGSRAKGKTYEKAVIKQFSKLNLGQLVPLAWFSFEDENGHGYCQTDLLIILPTYIIIVEVKLTQTTTAWAQLSSLYKPIIEKAFAKPAYTIQVCKNLRWETTAKVESISDFTAKPRLGLWTLHYLS